MCTSKSHQGDLAGFINSYVYYSPRRLIKTIRSGSLTYKRGKDLITHNSLKITKQNVSQEIRSSKSQYANS